jgi:hypothetical protein
MLTLISATYEKIEQVRLALANSKPATAIFTNNEPEKQEEKKPIRFEKKAEPVQELNQSQQTNLDDTNMRYVHIFMF